MATWHWLSLRFLDYLPFPSSLAKCLYRPGCIWACQTRLHLILIKFFKTISWILYFFSFLFFLSIFTSTGYKWSSAVFYHCFAVPLQTRLHLGLPDQVAFDFGKTFQKYFLNSLFLFIFYFNWVQMKFCSVLPLFCCGFLPFLEGAPNMFAKGVPAFLWIAWQLQVSARCCSVVPVFCQGLAVFCMVFTLFYSVLPLFCCAFTDQAAFGRLPIPGPGCGWGGAGT